MGFVPAGTGGAAAGEVLVSSGTAASDRFAPGTWAKLQIGCGRG